MLTLEKRLRERGWLSPEKSCFQLLITPWGAGHGLSPDSSLSRQADYGRHPGRVGITVNTDVLLKGHSEPYFKD